MFNLRRNALKNTHVFCSWHKTPNPSCSVCAQAKTGIHQAPWQMQEGKTFTHSMITWPANRDQPDICRSLTTEWTSEMMRGGEQAGVRWCQFAHHAQPGDGFYQRHKHEQTQLEQIDTIATLQTNINTMKNPQTDRQTALRLYQENKAIIPRLKNRELQESALANLRKLKVTSSMSFPTLENIEAEFMQLNDSSRFYLLTVQGTQSNHVISVISTKSSGYFTPRGDLYYYDPNLKQVIKMRSRNDLMRFIYRTVIGQDYGQAVSLERVEKL